jgi:hypothetical protein
MEATQQKTSNAKADPIKDKATKGFNMDEFVSGLNERMEQFDNGLEDAEIIEEQEQAQEQAQDTSTSDQKYKRSHSVFRLLNKAVIGPVAAMIALDDPKNYYWDDTIVEELAFEGQDIIHELMGKTGKNTLFFILLFTAIISTFAKAFQVRRKRKATQKDKAAQDMAQKMRDTKKEQATEDAETIIEIEPI